MKTDTSLCRVSAFIRAIDC